MDKNWATQQHWLQMRVCGGYGRTPCSSSRRKRRDEATSRRHRVCRAPFVSKLAVTSSTVGDRAAVVPMLRQNQTHAAAFPASEASTAHVYLLRGVLNIFSLGLDDIAAKLRAQGIPVTVANFVSWSSLADDAAAKYRSGSVKTIILVGHSSGATALPDMVARLDQLDIPVKLAIGLDSVFRTSLTGRVGRYLNFYVANGAGTPVEKRTGFRRLAGECQRRERAWRRAHVDRKKSDHAAKGDQRHRRCRVRSIRTSYGSAEAAAR